MGSVAKVHLYLCAVLLLSSIGWDGGVAVDATRVPGVNLEKIKVWDGSAKNDVWSFPNKYFDWRMYTLDRLSDMGFLDHLIDDMDEKLREIDDIGL